jgi:hypothetical protein
MPPSFLIFISSQQSAHKQETDNIVANMSKLYGINSLLSVENPDPYLKIKKNERDLFKDIFLCDCLCVY